MAEKKRVRSSTAGIRTAALPESPIFRSPAAERERSGLTVNGRPVEEMENGHLIGREFTDQGIAERQAKPTAFTATVSDPWDKMLDARANARMGIESFEAPDPLREAVERYVRPGFRGRFVSDSVVASMGMRGYEPVLVNGDPVKVGAMKLAEMPEEKVRRRNAFYQGKGAEKLRQTQEQHEEQIAKAAGEAGVRLPRARVGRTDPAGGLQEVRGNTILR